MATGSGKTFTACNLVYRLIKFAGAKRILFLVDRKTLGRQTLNEFQQFVTPDDGRKFTELYNAQLLASNKIDTVSKVCVTTIQRLYSMLVGREIGDEEQEERSAATWDQLTKLPEPITYNPTIPIETFDFIVTDECHRSIYNLWRQVSNISTPPSSASPPRPLANPRLLQAESGHGLQPQPIIRGT